MHMSKGDGLKLRKIFFVPVVGAALAIQLVSAFERSGDGHEGITKSALEGISRTVEGETLEWFESGQLRYRQNFSKGREDGLQQGWHDDGEPAFAYAYRDGRRYGVLGSKPCFTVTTDAGEAFNEKL